MITYALYFCQISMGKYGSEVSIFSQTLYTSHTPQNRPGTYLFSPTSGGVLISPITPYSGRRGPQKHRGRAMWARKSPRSVWCRPGVGGIHFSLFMG